MSVEISNEWWKNRKQASVIHMAIVQIFTKKYQVRSLLSELYILYPYILTCNADVSWWAND